jgi:hypothetical protein
MQEELTKARRLLALRPALASYEVRLEAEELHLSKEGECFVRLLPIGTAGQWRMEYFRNLEEWEILDFRGTLEECLDYLTEPSHDRFWEG